MNTRALEETSADGPVVFYDGVCGLCDRSVQALIRLDKGHRLRYATLQGVTALRIFGPPVGEAGSWSIKLLENDRVYDRSTAAIRAAILAGGLGTLAWPLLAIPRFVRDGVYRWIAKRRYRWFGQAESCMLPTLAVRKNFLP